MQRLKHSPCKQLTCLVPVNISVPLTPLGVILEHIARIKISALLGVAEPPPLKIEVPKQVSLFVVAHFLYELRVKDVSLGCNDRTFQEFSFPCLSVYRLYHTHHGNSSGAAVS